MHSLQTREKRKVVVMVVRYTRIERLEVIQLLRAHRLFPSLVNVYNKTSDENKQCVRSNWIISNLSILIYLNTITTTFL